MATGTQPSSPNEQARAADCFASVQQSRDVSISPKLKCHSAASLGARAGAAETPYRSGSDSLRIAVHLREALFEERQILLMNECLHREPSCPEQRLYGSGGLVETP